MTKKSAVISSGIAMTVALLTYEAVQIEPIKNPSEVKDTGSIGLFNEGRPNAPESEQIKLVESDCNPRVRVCEQQ